MKNVTFTVDDQVLSRARKRAHAKGTTLNNEVRAWMQQYANPLTVERYREIMRRISYVKTDRKYTRDEMNER